MERVVAEFEELVGLWALVDSAKVSQLQRERLAASVGKVLARAEGLAKGAV